MPILIAACGAALGGSGCGEAAPGAPPGPGVPDGLAESRARSIDSLTYQLDLIVPASRSEPLEGEIQIRFEWSGSGALALDFAADSDQVRAVEANGEILRLVPVNEHLVIPRSALRRGENTLHISFLAGDGSLNRTDDFLYTLFVPDRARWAFPLFDQPDLKARFGLTLDLPPDWVAVANGEELEVAGASRPGEGDRVVYRFRETEPIPSYLFSFAAGRFQVEEAVRDGRRMRLFHRETDRAKVARNVDEIFDLHARAIAWLEEYTGIPYPFGKFDFVAVPAFQYGGMEHPGAILYRAASLFLDESATQGQRLGRASVISHETSHMWFGDLVTMRWFDDVWMKEVFANFMAAKIVNPSFPDLDHELRFLLAHYPAAYAVDRTAGANPIRQPLENLNEAGTLYGAIIYQKAPVVMRLLERMVGEETFRDGLREYLDAHRFGNATWPDLIDVLDRRSPLDLRAWSHAWVEEPGRPTVTTEIAEEAPEAAPGGEGRGGVRVGFRQEDPLGRGLRWAQPLTPWLGFSDPWGAGPAGRGTLGKTLALDADTASFLVDGPPSTSLAAVLPNGDGLAYGRFPPDPGTREWLLGHFTEIEAGVPRAVAWLTLWDAMLEGDVTPDEWVGMATGAIDAEPEELIVSRMLGDLSTAYWVFLPPEKRSEVGPGLETLLWSRLSAARTVSLKASFFNAYVGLAESPAAVRRLESIWRAGGGVAGLPLSERDLTRLAQQLAVRGVANAESILDLQAGRIENPDRLAEFEFVRPSLSSDPAVRDAFFSSLADPTNREHEPWVLAGLGWLHHPLREEESRRYLRGGLDLLGEIQRTGDIFFPGRWLDAQLGGHGSPEAAETVQGFLDEHPDYPPRLRAKLLQSSDLLFRAAASRR